VSEDYLEYMVLRPLKFVKHDKSLVQNIISLLYNVTQMLRRKIIMEKPYYALLQRKLKSRL
jgi:hypothetical protein